MPAIVERITARTPSNSASARLAVANCAAAILAAPPCIQRLQPRDVLASKSDVRVGTPEVFEFGGDVGQRHSAVVGRI